MQHLGKGAWKLVQGVRIRFMGRDAVEVGRGAARMLKERVTTTRRLTCPFIAILSALQCRLREVLKGDFVPRWCPDASLGRAMLVRHLGQLARRVSTFAPDLSLPNPGQDLIFTYPVFKHLLMGD